MPSNSKRLVDAPGRYHCPHCQRLGITALQKLKAHAQAPAQCALCHGWCYVPTRSRNAVGAVSVPLLLVFMAVALTLGSWAFGVAGGLAVWVLHVRRWRGVALMPTTPVARLPERRPALVLLGLDVGVLLAWWLS